MTPIEWIFGLVGLGLGAIVTALILNAKHKEALSQKQLDSQQETNRLENQLESIQQELRSAKETLATANTSLAELREEKSQLIEQRSKLDGKSGELEKQVEAFKAEETALKEKINGFQETIKTLNAEKASLQSDFDNIKAQYEEWRAAFDTEWTEKFKALSKDALEEARQKMKKEFSEDHTERKKLLKEDIDAQLKPMTENFEAFKEKVTVLDSHITSLTSAKDQLVSVLKTNKGAGSWGELELIRILEFVGLKKDVDYEFQPNELNGRPDVKVFLPERGFVYVDAKTIQFNPDEAPVSDDPAEMEKRRQAILQSLKSAIKDLGGKDYAKGIQGTPDFVVLFVPRESMLSIAYEMQPSLWEEALNKNIILASPFNLIGLFRIIRFGWHQMELSKQVHEIKKLGVDLHEKLNVFFGKIVAFDKALTKVNDSYGEVKRTFDGQGGLVSKAKKLASFVDRSSGGIPKEMQECDLLAGEDDEKELVTVIPIFSEVAAPSKDGSGKHQTEFMNEEELA